MRIGFHIPFSGNLQKLKDRIIVSRGNTFQIFARGLRGGKIQQLRTSHLNSFHEFLERKNIKPTVVHAPYVYNLAQENSEDIELVLEDLEFADKLRSPYYIIHPGYSKDIQPFMAVQFLKENLTKLLDKTEFYGEILIKNMAGAGTEIGFTLEEWNELITFHPQVKGALDFSRAFSSGYNFTSEKAMMEFYEELEETVGWHKIKVLYINDTNRFSGSKKNDKVPPPLGQGLIGFKGYESILSREMVQSKIWLVENQPKATDYDKSIDFLTKFY